MLIVAALSVLLLAGPKAGSLHFTRRDQKVFVPYTKPLDIVGELTMEAWVFPEIDAKSRLYHWVLSRNYAPGGYGLVLEGRGTLVIGGTHETVPFDSWTHIAVVLGRRAEKVYVNGELATVVGGDHRVKARPTLPLYIGNSNFGGVESTEFTGRIAEVRVWSVGRGQDQIRRDMHRYLREARKGSPPTSRFAKPAGFSPTTSPATLCPAASATLTGPTRTRPSGTPVHRCRVHCRSFRRGSRFRCWPIRTAPARIASCRAGRSETLSGPREAGAE